MTSTTCVGAAIITTFFHRQVRIWTKSWSASNRTLQADAQRNISRLHSLRLHVPDFSVTKLWGKDDKVHCTLGFRFWKLTNYCSKWQYCKINPIISSRNGRTILLTFPRCSKASSLSALPSWLHTTNVRIRASPNFAACFLSPSKNSCVKAISYSSSSIVEFCRITLFPFSYWTNLAAREPGLVWPT